MDALARLSDVGETYVIDRWRRESPSWVRRAAAVVGSGADGGKLWLAAGGALAATGRTGRRAAAQGLAGYLVASAAANGILKHVTNRARPGPFARLPGPSGRSRRRTSSLPSSHTAGAVAFAVAASAAAPAASPVLSGLALLVAADRVLSGEHFPTDVLAGAAVGAATGIGTLAVARRAKGVRAASRPGRGAGHRTTATEVLAMTTAREIMTSNPAFCPEDTSAVDAARKMADEGVGALPVCHADGRLAGVVTDRDLAVHVVAEGRDPKDVRLGELLDGTEVVTIGADDSIEEAIQTMKDHAVRRLPVIDGDRMVGIVSQADIARAMPDAKIGDLVGAISSAPANG